ncbi:MAG: hypothetical protein MZU91_02760 [Desulfosudis oleivorans]|nr:hypothetical protein [Desulfosudis oleivorans]
MDFGRPGIVADLLQLGRRRRPRSGGRATALTSGPTSSPTSSSGDEIGFAFCPHGRALRTSSGMTHGYPSPTSTTSSCHGQAHLRAHPSPTSCPTRMPTRPR